MQAYFEREPQPVFVISIAYKNKTCSYIIISWT